MKLVSKEFSKDWGYWTPTSVVLLQVFLIAFAAGVAFSIGRMIGSAESNTPHEMVCTNQSDTRVVCDMVPKEVKP